LLLLTFPYGGNWSSTIHHDDVVGIAIVFSVEILGEFRVDFSRMTHVLFSRTENHIPFSMEAAESYPHRTEFGLEFQVFKIRLES
jgi:hypothetical protein